MEEYELFNEKTAEFFGTYLSDKMLEKGDVITFQGKNYFVSNLMILKDRKLRIAVWPAKINLPGDIEDLQLLNWIKKNLVGMKIRLSNNKNSIEGKVINYWPRIRFIPPDNLKPDERPETFYAEELPGRLEILSPGPDDLTMIDLPTFSMIEILGKY
jgi:hypothetical protein